MDRSDTERENISYAEAESVILPVTRMSVCVKQREKERECACACVRVSVYLFLCVYVCGCLCVYCSLCVPFYVCLLHYGRGVVMCLGGVTSEHLKSAAVTFNRPYIKCEIDRKLLLTGDH